MWIVEYSRPAIHLRQTTRAYPEDEYTRPTPHKPQHDTTTTPTIASARLCVCSLLRKLYFYAMIQSLSHAISTLLSQSDSP